MLIEVGDQAGGVKLAHVGKLVGKERLLIQSVDQRLGVERHQLDHTGQAVLTAVGAWRLVAIPDLTKAAFDRPYCIGAHPPDADHHRGVDGRLLKLLGSVRCISCCH